MNAYRLLLVATFLLALGDSRQALADEPPLPKDLKSAPSQKTPTIDGVLDVEEWQDAPALKFPMALIRLEPLANEVRACELRLKNSDKILYIALKVPDTTADDSLSPLRLDAAILGFAQGDAVKAHDDRKLVASGLYRDKAVVGKGKDDVDDPHQDGRGAMKRADGACTFEWAVPLASGDPDDLQAKPGDTLRFNILFADGFQVPITHAHLGGLFGPQMDTLAAWGTLALAANAPPDDLSALQGPAWIGDAAKTLAQADPGHLRVNSHALASGGGQPAARLLTSFTYRDEHGAEKEALAKLFLPDPPNPVAGAKGRRPLFFYAGYELPEGAERPYLDKGWIVSSPRDLPTNPLIRTANPDIALLHLLRALPWVDDTRVLIGGGSAGGWMTLRLAAETFPLAGAVPDVPPVNWGYNGAFLFSQLDKVGPPKPGAPSRVPVTYGVGTLLKPCLDVYGPDYGDANWFAASPIAQLDTITAPVSVCWSTADVLVPMDQIGARWVQPFDPAKFPPGYAMAAKALVSTPNGRLTLAEALPEDRFEAFPIKVPPGTALQDTPNGPGKPGSFEMPVSASRQWSIAIIDEGPPEPTVGHQKYAYGPTRETFFNHVLNGQVPLDQLTPTKLRRLMARYNGREWLPSRLQTLDRPEAERADVLRGLRTYAHASPDHARRLAELYEKLAPFDQALDVTTLKTLTTPEATSRR